MRGWPLPAIVVFSIGDSQLAKPNYEFEKRQRDLAKKQKKEAKRLRKAEAQAAPSTENTTPVTSDKPAP